MKCIVTGGAGFIGSHLGQKLLELGHEVLCIDNLITGFEANISSNLQNPKFKFIKHDVSQPLPEELKADVIFHFASPASPPKYVKYAVETLLVNTYGTYLLLELALKNNAKFIYASTSEVYGDPQVHPQPENYWGHVNPIGERSCYDESKRAGEAMVMSYVRNKNANATILRIFNTYGPRMDLEDGRVITNFINQIKHALPLTIYGKGDQSRSFCYISDLVDVILGVFQSDKVKGEVFNIGNPEEITIMELANLIIRLTDYKGKISFGKLPVDDPVRRRPDITKVKNLLGWESKIALEEGLSATIKHYLG
jgi:nucleoside-diphosphate-sugar epimerase